MTSCSAEDRVPFDPKRRWIIALLAGAVLAVGLLGRMTPQAVACEEICAAAEMTGMANPPAWATGKAVHFEPESAAVASPSAASLVASLSQGEELSGGPNAQLLFHSKGVVQHSPRIYVIFWGSNFEHTQAGNETFNMLLKFYEGLSNTTYQELLTQYFDETGRVGETVTMTHWIDAAGNAPSELRYESEITGEIERSITLNHWSPEANAQFVVVTAPGTTYYKKGENLLDKSCAWHSVTPAGYPYDFVPYQGDEPLDVGGEGCVSTGNPSKNPVIKTSKSASHEYAEAATDPRVNTWYTQGGDEIADICQEESDFELPDGAWAQTLSNNDWLYCSKGESKPAYAYVDTYRPMCLSEPPNYYIRFNVITDFEDGGEKYWFEYGPNRHELYKTTEIILRGSTESMILGGLSTSPINLGPIREPIYVRAVEERTSGEDPGTSVGEVVSGGSC